MFYIELEIIKTVQSISNPFLDVMFETITTLGEGGFIGALVLFVYWCANKKMGRYLGGVVLFSTLLNIFLKDIFKLPRPIGKDGIKTLRYHTAGGYSFPSGHSQVSSTLFAGVMLCCKKHKVTIVSVTLILLIGLSRIYLGVHYPKDVIVGIIIGTVLSLVFYRLGKKISFVYTYLFLSIGIVAVVLFTSAHINLKIAGALIGFSFGIWFEERFVLFDITKSGFNKAVRFILGLLLIFVIRLTLKLILPKGEIADVIGYLVLTFFSVGVYPATFKKLKM